MNIDHLKKARENKGFTQAQAAKKLGISDGAYKNYEQGKREPNNNLLCKISTLFGVTTDYLLGMEVPPDPLDQLTEEELEKRFINNYLKLPKPYRQQFLKGLREAVAQCYGLTVEELEAASKQKTEQTNTQTEVTHPQIISAGKPLPTRLSSNPKSKRPKRPTIEIRHSIYKASAGPGYDLTDDDAWEIIKIPDTPEASEADFALTIEGDSMEPDYSDGDIVLVKQQPDVEIGQVGVFIVNGEGYIKERGESCLISRNPARGNIYDEALCVGKVLGKAFEDEDDTEEE